MLYVSRVAGYSEFELTYGIVDTDDDTETMVDSDDLESIIWKNNVKIVGAEVDLLTDSITPQTMIPYQDPRYVTKTMAKLKTMAGVDIRVWRKYITGIFIDCSASKRGTFSIRLSDFGRVICGFTPVNWFYRYASNRSGRPKLTITLDDKIDVPSSEFPIFASGIHWDFSEVTDDNFVEEVNQYMHVHYMDFDYQWNYLHDKSGRLEK